MGIAILAETLHGMVLHPAHPDVTEASHISQSHFSAYEYVKEVVCRVPSHLEWF